MELSSPAYRVDPDDPRAPSQEVWDRLSPEERERIVEELPSEFPPSESMPPEGDEHFAAKVAARQTLRDFFARAGRKVYLANELPVYYPGESMFAPDVMAVIGAELHPRMRWVVSAEGKGLDLAMEIHVSGNRRKDFQRNLGRYARLGIGEYFVYDHKRGVLYGYSLVAGAYEPMEPDGSHFLSEVLGLGLGLEGNRLRFYCGDAPVLEMEERMVTLEYMVGQTTNKLEQEVRRREEMELVLAQEAMFREEAERMLAQQSEKYAEQAQKYRELEQKLVEETRTRQRIERELAEALAARARGSDSSDPQ